jgi:hypothetical protein
VSFDRGCARVLTASRWQVHDHLCTRTDRIVMAGAGAGGGLSLRPGPPRLNSARIILRVFAGPVTTRTY